MKASTESDETILKRHIPPNRPKNEPCPATCIDMHADGYCICMTVACVFCDKHHPPHKACRPQSSTQR